MHLIARFLMFVLIFLAVPVTIDLMQPVTAPAPVSAQRWVVDTDWYRAFKPEQSFEVGKMYFHPYTARIYIMGRARTLAGRPVLIVQVIQAGGFQLCGQTDTDPVAGFQPSPAICAFDAETRRGSWMEMMIEGDTP